MPSSSPPSDDGVLPVHLDDVTVTIGHSTLLDDVDLHVHTGEAVAVLGANGSGKSTLIRTLLGQMPLVRGDAQIFGASTAYRPSAVPWDRVGYVPQRLSAASGVPATALEVVTTGLLGRRRWWLGRTARQRALDAMEMLGVADLAHRPFTFLSGGQAQRVVIARALVREPDLLVLDEPLAGVDILTQSSFASVLQEVHDQGRTIVVVLHELGPFAEMLDRAVVLSAGRVIHDGDLPRDHHHPHWHDEHGHQHTDHALPDEPPTQRSLP